MRYAMLALVLVNSCLWAQQRNAPVPGASPFGSVLFPGGTGPANGNNGAPFGSILFPGTGGAPAAARAPSRGGNMPGGNPAPPAPHPGHPNGGNVLVPYPVYFSGGNNYVQYDPPQAQLARDYVPTPGQQDASPVVIVNQYFRPDVPPAPPVTQPAQVAAPETREVVETRGETIFLIALKDHTIYAANAYWVEDGILNYVTIQGSQNSASMDLVDRDLSRRLNRDRSVAFGLPLN